VRARKPAKSLSLGRRWKLIIGKFETRRLTLCRNWRTAHKSRSNHNLKFDDKNRNAQEAHGFAKTFLRVSTIALLNGCQSVRSGPFTTLLPEDACVPEFQARREQKGLRPIESRNLVLVRRLVYLDPCNPCGSSRICMAPSTRLLACRKRENPCLEQKLEAQPFLQLSELSYFPTSSLYLPFSVPSAIGTGKQGGEQLSC
jgi:hypothetical protein